MNIPTTHYNSYRLQPVVTTVEAYFHYWHWHQAGGWGWYLVYDMSENTRQMQIWCLSKESDSSRQSYSPFVLTLTWLWLYNMEWRGLSSPLSPLPAIIFVLQLQVLNLFGNLLWPVRWSPTQVCKSYCRMQSGLYNTAGHCTLRIIELTKMSQTRILESGSGPVQFSPTNRLEMFTIFSY